MRAFTALLEQSTCLYNRYTFITKLVQPLYSHSMAHKSRVQPFTSLYSPCTAIYLLVQSLYSHVLVQACITLLHSCQSLYNPFTAKFMLLQSFYSHVIACTSLVQSYDGLWNVCTMLFIVVLNNYGQGSTASYNCYTKFNPFVSQCNPLYNICTTFVIGFRC